MTWIIEWTDFAVYLLLIGFSLYGYYFRRTPEWRILKRVVIQRPRYLVAALILLLYAGIGILDCIHFKENTQTISVLDFLLSPRSIEQEKTYSAPFSLRLYDAELVKKEGKLQQIYPRLSFAGEALAHASDSQTLDITVRMCKGLILGLSLTGLLYLFGFLGWRQYFCLDNIRTLMAFYLTSGTLICLVCLSGFLMFEYHILGTDKVGRDVFYMAIKSIRTGLVIGTVTSLFMLPFALLFGLLAGYLRGWLDDLIQYLYTTLNAVPGVLLIAALMLALQAKIETDADLRLLLLCMVLGLTSWTTLCRLIRAETFKLREAEFIQSAIGMGVGKMRIMLRHILPNLMHIVLITVVLDFSGLILAETILSYVGIGVDASTYSWGNLINASRLEMARDPMVWWALFGSLLTMFFLVFSVNIFSDALQEALNPKAV
jgi:peptide/nickel transport system permease protein